MSKTLKTTQRTQNYSRYVDLYGFNVVLKINQDWVNVFCVIIEFNKIIVYYQNRAMLIPHDD